MRLLLAPGVEPRMHAERPSKEVSRDTVVSDAPAKAEPKGETQTSRVVGTRKEEGARPQ